MKRIVSILVGLCFVILGLASIASAQDTTYVDMNYQGYLTDDAGNPLTGSYDLTFSIHDSSEAGTTLWTETHMGVTVNGGYFEVVLGSTNPMPLDVLALDTANGDIPKGWLEVKIGADPPISPRTQLTSAPYAGVATRLRGDVITGPGLMRILGEADHPVFAVSAEDSTLYFGTGWTTADHPVFAVVIPDGAMFFGQNYGQPDQAGVVLYDDGDAEFTGDVSIGVPPGRLSDTKEGAEELAGWPNLHIYQDIDGLIGIQIENPNTGSNSCEAIYFTNEDGGYAGIRLFDEGSSAYPARMNIFNNRPSGSIHFGTGGFPSRMTIANGGNVGIGNTEPNELLTVEGVVSLDETSAPSATPGYGKVYVKSTDSKLYFKDDAGTEYDLTTGGGGDNDWSITGDVLFTGDEWGIARSGNTLYGDHDSTHVCLGAEAITGTNGQHYKYCTVGGGFSNVASGDRATVGGGAANGAVAQYATVGGGLDNVAGSIESSVAGGSWNTASGMQATIGGGTWNVASGNGSTVAGGGVNKATEAGATIGGGSNNVASYAWGTVGGGYRDTTNAIYGGVFCGYSNLGGDENDDTAAFVGGGYDNSALAKYATVSGGKENSASAPYSTVGGGVNDTASYEYATVGGGQRNSATEWRATVAGGGDNDATGGSSTIGGGSYNGATSVGGTVSGGVSNYANGAYSTVPGGRQNQADGDYSLAAGRKARASHDGTFVFADDTDADFTSTAAKQFLIRAAGGVGINVNNPTEALDVSGNIHASGTITSGSSITIDGANDKITASSGTIDFDNENLVTTGDVGIGTTSPNDKLEVNGAIRFGTGVLVINQARAYTTGVSGLVVSGEPGSSTDFDITESGGYSIMQNPAGTTDLALVIGGGGVGVGTTSPGNLLDVEGAGTDEGGVAGSDEVTARFKQTSSSKHSAISVDALSGQDPTVYFAEDGEAMWSLRHDSDDADKFQLRYHGQTGMQRKAITVDSLGQVGIGVTTPTELLDVNETARLRSMPTGTGTAVIVDGDGVLKKLTSSRRYKQNIRELEADPSLIFQLRPVTFDWKTTGEEDIGLIAEEVEKMLPDLVIYDNQGRPDAVKYDRVAIYLLAAMKELKAENDALKALVEQVLAEREGTKSGDNKTAVNR